MSHAPRAKLRRGKGPRGHYRLRLFIAGDGPNSKQALANLRRLCQQHLNGRCTIEVVDVVKHYQAAVSDNILVTPALVLVAPRPRVIVLGNLSDRQKLLNALRLPEGGLMNKRKPTYQELEKRLAVAEPIVEALKHHEVDAVVGEGKIAFLLLRGVEEALLNSEAGFRALFELPAIGMFQADTPDFRFVRVNQKFCEITGYTAGELLTKTYIGLTHPQDRRRDMNGLTRVLRGNTDSWSIEKRCVRKDGSVIRVGVSGTALRDDTGRAVRIMGMISEITQ